jgi:hypothetical protein
LDELSLLLLLALKLFIVTIIKAAFLKQPQPKLQGKDFSQQKGFHPTSSKGLQTLELLDELSSSKP